MLVERFLCRVEECRAEAERHRSTDDGEIEIEQIAHRRDRLADEPTGALHDLVGRLGVWAAGDGLDRRARSLGFETTAGSAGAAATVRFDDRMADVAGVAGCAVEQLAVQ